MILANSLKQNESSVCIFKGKKEMNLDLIVPFLQVKLAFLLKHYPLT